VNKSVALTISFLFRFTFFSDQKIFPLIILVIHYLFIPTFFDFIMIRLSKYFLITFMIYILTILLSFFIYFMLILLEKRIPIITLCAYSIGETILNGLNLFSIPLRYFLPNLTDDEYYLILVNGIVTTFAFAYAYLFCKLDEFYNEKSFFGLFRFRYYSSGYVHRYISNSEYSIFAMVRYTTTSIPRNS
jgi:hypothetical protein